MKKNTILLSLIAVPFLIGCGSDSSDTLTNTQPTATSKISGTVPGTLIEAFCEDGTYVQVSSTQNGTNQHPFEIEVPQNTNCRLVMTTNEYNDTTRVITPIGFIHGTVTGSTISLSGDINLSHIPLELDYTNVSDSDGNHVVDNDHYVNLNNATNASVNSTSVFDMNRNGYIDVYEDDDNNGRVNAYEDDDNDGRYNIHDDDDDDKYPDYIEDDDNDDKYNYQDDDDDNSYPDYIEDYDNDGKPNFLDDDDNDDYPDYIQDHDNDGKPNYLDDDYDDDYDYNDYDDNYISSGGTTATAKLFSTDVMPILINNCKSCHGTAGNFTITSASETYTNIMSLNYGTSNKDRAEYMKDKGDGDYRHGGGDKLNDTEYNTLESWIYGGAMNN